MAKFISYFYWHCARWALLIGVITAWVLPLIWEWLILIPTAIIAITGVLMIYYEKKIYPREAEE